MRHSNNTRKFGREKNERKALMRSLARNIIRDTKIKLTLAKAKELRPFIEKIVTIAKVNSVASRRLLSSRIHGAKEIKRLFDAVAPKYLDRKGGYTRIIKLPTRDTDGSNMAIIEFV